MRDVEYVFEQVCQGFYPHSDQEYSSTEAWVFATVEGFTRAPERAALKNYLDDLLDGHFSDAELYGVWLGTNPSFVFSPNNGRPLLTLMRDSLVELTTRA